MIFLEVDNEATTRIFLSINSNLDLINPTLAKLRIFGAKDNIIELN